MSYLENPNDWDNPDAWLYIPKFGVKPSEVNFEGFRYPIFTTKADYGLAENIVSLIGTARKLIQIDFNNIDELNQSFIEALDELENPDAILRQRLRAAVLYKLFISDIERVTTSRTSPNKKLVAMASAASSLASWAADGSEIALKRISQAQANGRIGKTKLKDIQKRQVIREYEAAPITYGMIKSLARKFDVSDDTISRIVNVKPIQKATMRD